MSLTAQQQYAIECALNGNREVMDDMELKALALLVHPHYANGEPYAPTGQRERYRSTRYVNAGLALFPVWIQRAAGPTGETQVVWSPLRPCGRCWRRLHRRIDCDKCDGRGYLTQDDYEHEVYTDLDGVVIRHGDGSAI